MEGRKLLNFRYKLCFLVNFRDSCSFSFLYTYFELKPYIIQQFSVSKKTANLTVRKKWRLWGKKMNYFFVYYILDIYYSFNSIVLSIAWMHSTHMQWWTWLFNKVEANQQLQILASFEGLATWYQLLHHNCVTLRLLISTLISIWV